MTSSCPSCGKPVSTSARQCPHCGVPFVASRAAALFDPYHEWLGIPPREQPANFYRLLGIATFERAPKVIENAADRQITHVRRLQAQHPTEATQVLNMLTKARVTLLSEKRASYDRALTSASDTRVSAPPPPPSRSARPGPRSPSPATRPAAMTAQTAPKPAPRMIACPSCDAPISSSVRMCPHCGDPFVNLDGTQSLPTPPVVRDLRPAPSETPLPNRRQQNAFRRYIQWCGARSFVSQVFLVCWTIFVAGNLLMMMTGAAERVRTGSMSSEEVGQVIVASFLFFGFVWFLLGVPIGIAAIAMFEGNTAKVARSPDREPEVFHASQRSPSGRSHGEKAARAAIVFGFLGILAGVFCGGIASQFFPVFGGFLIQIAQPFSPARLQTLPAHCIAGGIVGAMFVGGGGAMLQYAGVFSSRRQRIR